MKDINLLPEELKPSSSVIKLSANLKKIALLGVVILFISLTLSLGAYLFFSQRVSSTLTEQENIKVQIKTMEKTEQRLVLVKDRLGKIGSVYRSPRANDEVEKLNTVSSLFPENTFVEEVDLNENNANVAISSATLDNVTIYLASVISSGNYTKVNLESLEFDPEKGYVVELSFPE
jgi:hypothetical protein